MKVSLVERKTEKKKLKVAAYCRVSTDHDDQENSLENQIAHYEEEIKHNPGYEFAGVYYDFGMSGFKEGREGFQELIDDAMEGKIDLIITKSISRFARNTAVFLDAVRKLKEKGVGVLFELQHINSLSANGELMMTIYAAFAEAESRSTRELIKLYYRRKYEAGEPIHYLYKSFGYTRDEDGVLKIDHEEAKWVRKAYQMAADGYTDIAIINQLNSNGITSPTGVPWTSSSTLRMLSNEIYKGDYMMHKYYVDERGKLMKNRGEADRWYITDDHEAIVSKQLWQKAQDVRAARLKRRRHKDEEGDRQYKDKLFCAYCGHPLYRRVYSNGNRICWICSGVSRYGKEFCAGVNVPDMTVYEWNITENAYVYLKTRKRGVCEYGFYSESYWRREHKKKKNDPYAPELNEDNYPYMNKLFCARCGSRLVRYVQRKNSKVFWICNGNKRKGSSYCEGIRIPDDELKKIKINGRIYMLERRRNDGTKCYSYTCAEGEGEGTKER